MDGAVIARRCPTLPSWSPADDICAAVKRYAHLRALWPQVYEGSGTQAFVKDVQGYFNKVARMRVDASRSMSREFYVVATGRKKPAPVE
jgi:23S rRNA U2552 (ribose-2'-O)-methylase RlmE/FtsJ